MSPDDYSLDYTARDMIGNEDFANAMRELLSEVKLGEIWRTLLAGRGITSEDAKMLMVDLLMVSDYFSVAPPEATGDMLQRREGKREVMARILFLSDLPGSAITRLRRDVLDELQKGS